ncbi:MAG TPA: glycosyltransferase family 61 protein [Mucilaginibacter sp.]|nr:glycosyltransferase family 61 protein [Mucilaginibacter sp.]
MKYTKYETRAIGLKRVYIRLQDLFLKWHSYHLLSLEQTVAFMKPYEIMFIPENTILLPEFSDCADPEKNIFKEKTYTTEGVYVWDYKDNKRKAELSTNGSVILQDKVLRTDYDHWSFYKDVRKKDTRPVKEVPVMIAPFSHFQEKVGYGGYFDYVFLVATKLTRIKEALPDEDLSDVIISYPPYHDKYESDYLSLLDFNPANLIDSSKYKVVSPRVITANSSHWHPNFGDIQVFKKHIEKKFKPVKTESNRIYISRKGRRQVINEDELIVLLKKFDFQIIEDIPRTIFEQISIYHNASFIIGPHGASFANIIWCEPGTQLFELFSSNYVPDFFVYLTTVMHMKYTAYYDGVPDSTVNYLDGISENMYISIPALETCLKNIFETAN